MTLGLEDAMLPRDLPGDLPGFLERFGSDDQCRAYLFEARWPEGFRCSACGRNRAWAHKARLIYECAACGKQHSLLAGTIFEQTKTGLAKWFLAIYLLTSSKGGISAMELQRQMGFGSYQTAWSWLHKIRKAMVRPEREPLSMRVEADETYVGGLAAAGYAHEPVNLAASWGDAALRLPAIHLVFGLAKRWLFGTHHGAVSSKHLGAYLDEFVFRFNRRTAKSLSHRFARVIEHAVQIPPTTYRALVAAPA
jgi:ribosomal protein L37AE/L43A